MLSENEAMQARLVSSNRRSIQSKPRDKAGEADPTRPRSGPIVGDKGESYEVGSHTFTWTL